MEGDATARTAARARSCAAVRSRLFRHTAATRRYSKKKSGRGADDCKSCSLGRRTSPSTTKGAGLKIGCFIHLVSRSQPSAARRTYHGGGDAPGGPFPHQPGGGGAPSTARVGRWRRGARATRGAVGRCARAKVWRRIDSHWRMVAPATARERGSWVAAVATGRRWREGARRRRWRGRR